MGEIKYMGMENNGQARSSGKVKVGDRAPDFTLADQAGKEVQFGELLGKKSIVLYFYPKDETAGCTAEACAFRDSYEVFKDEGAEVVGVSSDSTAAHQQFATKHRLPFVLLSDTNGSVRKRYGVPTTFGLLPGRVTYVIDKQGIVRNIFSAQFTPEKHITQALKTLQDMEKERV
jgi:thioredoxin-dependent peroxiredoxin